MPLVRTFGDMSTNLIHEDVRIRYEQSFRDRLKRLLPTAKTSLTPASLNLLRPGILLTVGSASKMLNIPPAKAHVPADHCSTHHTPGL